VRNRARLASPRTTSKKRSNSPTKLKHSLPAPWVLTAAAVGKGPPRLTFASAGMQTLSAGLLTNPAKHGRRHDERNPKALTIPR
jgi:hypothetical protein